MGQATGQFLYRVATTRSPAGCEMLGKARFVGCTDWLPRTPSAAKISQLGAVVDIAGSDAGCQPTATVVVGLSSYRADGG